MKRREFIVCGSGAVVALGVSAWTGMWSRTGEGVGRVSGALPFAVIFDDRFPESLRFGNSAAQLGFEARSISGDVTDLCVRELRPLWARGEGIVLGMTSAVSLLCIQQLAAEFWMRVVARVEHVPQSDASVHHRMQLHEDVVPELKAALVHETTWAASVIAPLVQALRHSPSSRPARAFAVTRQSSFMPSKTPLVSWAIASRKGVPT